jgi:hypothetical protein
MNARDQDIIVELAAENHRAYWRASSDVSAQTKSAQFVCARWQEAVKDDFHDRFSVEYPVGDGFKEKIDLVDLEESVAYEFKVSKNNTHFEFYRDIFKVAVHNSRNPSRKIKKLVFITPEAGADKLRTDYGEAVRALAGKHHAIEVEICGIRSRQNMTPTTARITKEQVRKSSPGNA